MECNTFDIQLPPHSRGFHLVTGEIMRRVPRLPRNGVMVLFLKHTSAALTLNENADPDVRQDFEAFFRRAVPDGAPYFCHTLEGPDDMSAHIKASLLGASVTIPIREGRLNLGTWQGIYLCEFRNEGGARTVSVTLMGE
ncbi:MAG: secondary thiamine-phosphate synthase enzyme YjbQ [Bacteroidaceae bacterium]